MAKYFAGKVLSLIAGVSTAAISSGCSYLNGQPSVFTAPDSDRSVRVLSEGSPSTSVSESGDRGRGQY
jgi:hypothetical protein